jgi:cytidylate kinase
MNNQNLIINVGRQLGSGGRIIAKKLAEDFGCKFYDRELLNLAARESGFSEKVFEKHDEHKHTLLSVLHFHTPYVSDVNFYHNCLSEESLFKFQSDAILTAAQEGNCVFVGRCADYILRDFERVVNIFITASDEDRIRRVSEREGLNVAAARKFIQNGDNCRSSYYNYYTGKTWGAAESYDLCINSSLLGIDDTELFIKEFIEKKDKK